MRIAFATAREASRAMLYEFSLPTKSDKVPAGSDWIHEIKYDGCRLDRAYGVGKCSHWVKVKNPAHPAYCRVRDALIRTRQTHF